MVQTSTSEMYPQRSLRDIYYVMFRHKWKIICFFLAVVIVVGAVTFLSAKIYRSEARVMVRIGRESVTLPPTATTGSVVAYGLDRENEINSEMEILRSRELAERVVDDIGPEMFLNRGNRQDPKPDATAGQGSGVQAGVQNMSAALERFLEGAGIVNPLDRREKAIIRFMQNVKVETQKNSDIISVSYEAYTPEDAQRALAKLVELFQEKHISAHRSSGSFEFFSKEVDQLRNTLMKEQGALENLKQQKQLASLEEKRKIALERIGALEKETESTQAALAISRAKVADLKKMLAGQSQNVVTSETRISNYGTELMRTKLYDLKLKEQEYLTKYSETSIPVQEIQRQVKEAQALLDKENSTRTEVTTGINTTYQELNRVLLMEMANLSSLEAKSPVLERQLREARGEIAELIAAEMRLTTLNRELALLDGKYRKYSENLEQARIEHALEMNKISNISIIQAASSSTKPVRPRKGVNMALGIAFGILGGIGLAFFSHLRDHSLKTPQDIEEKLGLQMLASVPYVQK